MNHNEADVKSIKAKKKSDPKQIKRDPTMTGGEKAETPVEREERERRAREPKEAPIIQKTPG